MKGISSEMPFLFLPTVTIERFGLSDLSETSRGNHAVSGFHSGSRVS